MKNIGSKIKTYATVSSIVIFIISLIIPIILIIKEYAWWIGLIIFCVGCGLAFGFNRLIYYLGDHIEKTSPIIEDDNPKDVNSAKANECPICFHPINSNDAECKFCGYTISNPKDK